MKNHENGLHVYVYCYIRTHRIRMWADLHVYNATHINSKFIKIFMNIRSALL